jgi:hypothetical protein
MSPLITDSPAGTRSFTTVLFRTSPDTPATLPGSRKEKVRNYEVRRELLCSLHKRGSVSQKDLTLFHYPKLPPSQLQKRHIESMFSMQ